MRRIRLAEQEAGAAADGAPPAGAAALAVGRRERATTLQGGGTLK
jgi:hypothetical protein